MSSIGKKIYTVNAHYQYYQIDMTGRVQDDRPSEKCESDNTGAYSTGQAGDPKTKTEDRQEN